MSPRAHQGTAVRSQAATPPPSSPFGGLRGLWMLNDRGELGCIDETGMFRPDPNLPAEFTNYAREFLRVCETTADVDEIRIGLLYRSARPKVWEEETLLLTDALVRRLYPISGNPHSLTGFQKKKREMGLHAGIELLLNYAMPDDPELPVFIPVLRDRREVLASAQAVPAEIVESEAPHTPVLEVLNFLGPASVSRKDPQLFLMLKQRMLQTFLNKPAAAPSAVADALARADDTDRAPKMWYDPSLHNDTCEHLQRHLMSPREHVDAEDIRHFVRFRQLTVAQLKALARLCPVYAAPPGTALLERGTIDQWNMYLLRGQLELVAADNKRVTIGTDTRNADNVISMLKPRKYSVMTITPVRFLWVHEAMIEKIQNQETTPDDTAGTQFTLMP